MDDNEARAAGHLTTYDRIGDLLTHPAFRGFAPLLLPWNGRAYDERMRLGDVGELLHITATCVPMTSSARSNG